MTPPSADIALLFTKKKDVFSRGRPSQATFQRRWGGGEDGDHCLFFIVEIRAFRRRLDKRH